jgi:protease IV
MDSSGIHEGGLGHSQGPPIASPGPVGPPPPPPPPPPPIVVQQSGGFFGRFGKFLWIALLVSIMFNIGQRIAYQDYFVTGEKIQEKYVSGARHAADKIAVIRVEGAIYKADGYIKRQIDQVRHDAHVKAIVLRVNSPGGTVTASDYLYHHLKKMLDERGIPMVVSMGSMCASGGYYVAMAVGDEEDCIFAEETTWTGSIGVIIPHYDVSELLERWHVKDDSIASGPLKQLGSPTQVLSDEERAKERAVLQTMVDETFGRFKEVVCNGRPAFRDDTEALKKVTTGQVFTAGQALDNGLIDRVGFLEEAVARAAEMASLNKQNVRVVKYTRQVPGLLEMLSGTEAHASLQRGIDIAQLMDLATPRAYYLYSWLPSALSNSR